MCRQAVKEGILSFCKNAEVAFTNTGFDNLKKSVEKFQKHKASQCHRESILKVSQHNKPSVNEIISS